MSLVLLKVISEIRLYKPLQQYCHLFKYWDYWGGELSSGGRAFMWLHVYFIFFLLFYTVALTY